MSPPPEQAALQSVQGRKKKPALVAAAVVVILGGAGVAAKAVGGGSKGTEGAGEHAEPRSATTIVTLEPFILNLADQEDDRYLRATVRIVLEGVAAKEEEGEGAEGEKPEHARLRDRIITILGSKQAEEITSFDGKEALRAEVRSEVGELFEGSEVRDVLFTEFLIQ